MTPTSPCFLVSFEPLHCTATGRRLRFRTLLLKLCHLDIGGLEAAEGAAAESC